jgi:hypothetical protein
VQQTPNRRTIAPAAAIAAPCRLRARADTRPGFSLRTRAAGPNFCVATEGDTHRPSRLKFGSDPVGLGRLTEAAQWSLGPKLTPERVTGGPRAPRHLTGFAAVRAFLENPCSFLEHQDGCGNALPISDCCGGGATPGSPPTIINSIRALLRQTDGADMSSWSGHINAASAGSVSACVDSRMELSSHQHLFLTSRLATPHSLYRCVRDSRRLMLALEERASSADQATRQT